MPKTRTSWEKGTSGNPKGRPIGTGRTDEYRALLEPAMPELLEVLVGKAREGDLTAMRLVLERVFPVRDSVVADMLADIEELRALIEARRTGESEGRRAQ